jgi:DnaJ-class molecular chaperone
MRFCINCDGLGVLIIRAATGSKSSRPCSRCNGSGNEPNVVAADAIDLAGRDRVDRALKALEAHRHAEGTTNVLDLLSDDQRRVEIAVVITAAGLSC